MHIDGIFTNGIHVPGNIIFTGTKSLNNKQVVAFTINSKELLCVYVSEEGNYYHGEYTMKNGTVFTLTLTEEAVNNFENQTF